MDLMDFVSGVNVISVEEAQEMCQGTSVRVVCISYVVVCGGTYMWLEWCPDRVCSGVCAPVRVVIHEKNPQRHHRESIPIPPD